MQTFRINKTELTTKNKFIVDVIALGREKKNLFLGSRRVLICLLNFSLRKKLSFSQFLATCWPRSAAFGK